jgi:hypothetical protein
MADTLATTGSLAFTDNSPASRDFNYDLANVFGSQTINEQNIVRRKLNAADGEISVDLGGVSDVKGFFLWIISGSGTVTLKHDANSAAMEISKAMHLVGKISAIKLQTTAISNLLVEYMVYE